MRKSTAVSHDTLLLLTCGGKKADAKDAPHKDGFTPDELYTGGFFQAELRFARSTGLPWAVLGLKYGVIPCTHRLMPYDLTPPRKQSEFPPEWRVKVLAQLHALKVKRALFVTNYPYFEPFIGVPGTRWCFDDLPRVGAGCWGMGKKKKWFIEHMGKAPRVEGVLPSTIEPMTIQRVLKKGAGTTRRAPVVARQQSFIIDTE